MKARGRKCLSEVSSEKKSSKLKLTPWGKKTLLFAIYPSARRWLIIPSLRSDLSLKVLLLAALARINYDFKAETSPFTNGSLTRAWGCKESLTSRRNMATRKMNFYPRFHFLSALSRRIMESPILPLVTLGGAREGEQVQWSPVGRVHAERGCPHKRHRLLLRRIVRLSRRGGWPGREGQVWGWNSGPEVTWKCPPDVSHEISRWPEIPGRWGSV